MSHTPGPWQYASILAPLCVLGPTGRELAQTIIGILDPTDSRYPTAVGEAADNAKYIVRCVNTHEKLLAALKAAVVELDSTINNPRTAWDLARAGEIIRMARAAIARATKDTREGLDPSTRAS